MEKARELQKNIYFCFIDYAKAFNYVDHNKLWKILQEMGIPDHLTCLLRNLYQDLMFLSRGDRDLGVAFQTHLVSQALSRREAKDSILLSSRA